MYYYYPHFTRQLFSLLEEEKKVKIFAPRLGKAQLDSLAYGDHTWGLSRRQRFGVLVCVDVIMLPAMK